MIKSETIMVVDDVPENIALLIEALSCDYNILVAEDGQSCLDQIPHARPDLILLDVKMPKVDGFDVCRQLQTSTEWSSIPIIFMTAIDSPREKSQALELGAVDYVTKPVYIPEVIARVKTHLRIQKLQNELRLQNEQLELEILMRKETEAQLQNSLEQAILATSLDGQIIFSTELARNLLVQFFKSASKIMLPPNLLVKFLNGDFLKNQESKLTFQHPTEDRELIIRKFDGGIGSQSILFHLEEAKAHMPSKLFKLGLSPRESEVLFWIAEGKTYPEIATILEASVRTIHKHSENVFRKLNVESKSAAMRLAIDTLAQ